MSYDKAIAQLRMGPSRPTLYKVIMPSRFIGRETNDYLEYYCNATSLPSVRYLTKGIDGQQFMGISRLQPYMPVFTQPFEIDIIENANFATYKEFKENWFDKTAEGIDQQNNRNIRLKYFNDIIGDIELIKLENPESQQGGGGQQLREVMKVKFLDAYIKAIGSINLASNAFNTYTTFKVEFNYRSFTTEVE